jgi:hypothetical protein
MLTTVDLRTRCSCRTLPSSAREFRIVVSTHIFKMVWQRNELGTYRTWRVLRYCTPLPDGHESCQIACGHMHCVRLMMHLLALRLVWTEGPPQACFPGLTCPLSWGHFALLGALRTFCLTSWLPGNTYLSGLRERG